MEAASDVLDIPIARSCRAAPDNNMVAFDSTGGTDNQDVAKESTN